MIRKDGMRALSQHDVTMPGIAPNFSRSCAATAVEAVVRGQIPAKGVYAPEGCIDDPAPFLAEALRIIGVNAFQKKEVVAPMLV